MTGPEVTVRVTWFNAEFDEVTGYNNGGGRHMVACMLSHETPRGDVISSPTLCSTADIIIDRVVPDQDGQYMLPLPTPRPRRRRRRRTVPSPAGDQFLLFDVAS